MAPFKHKLLILAVLGVAARAEDAREIVRKSLALDEHNTAIARNYTFLELNVLRQYDGEGKVKSMRSRTFDITIQEDSPYRRLIARDGKPLSESEEAREKENLRRSIDDRRRETPSQRSKRLAEYEKRRERQRRFLREIPNAFEFTTISEERFEGRDVWVIRAAPRLGYNPQTAEGRVLGKLAGKLWIDKAELQCAKVEAESVEPVSFGWLLVRVAKGAAIEIAQTRVNDEVWLPKHVLATFRARIGLVKGISGQYEITYSDYRKFQAQSRMVTDTPDH